VKVRISREAARLDALIREADARLEATAQWFTLFKKTRRAPGVVAGDPQDLYFQLCFELATQHGEPSAGADGLARAALSSGCTAESRRPGAASARCGRAGPSVAGGAGADRDPRGSRRDAARGSFRDREHLALREFRRARPEVEVVAFEGRSGTLMECLAEGALDLAVVSDYTSGLPSADGVTTAVLLEDELFVALHREHPWREPGRST
jgi:hypothetical protein